MKRKAKTIAGIPLVVDLDGTLSKVDTLQEAFLGLLATRPLRALQTLFALGSGRPAFKAAVADHVSPELATLPFNESVVEAVKQARKKGRKVYLATAADKRFADALAKATGKFDGVFATEKGHNLKGKAKADCLIDAFGVHGFDYIGNDANDFPVWRAARTALIAGAPPRLVEQLNQERPNSVALDTRKTSLAPYFWALRPHQWLKNILLALPAIAAHAFNADALMAVLIAFASFSLGASAFYLLNDMLDLPHDRAHPEKRFRPIAAGTVPVSHAFVFFCCLLAISIGLALMLPRAFFVILIAYFALSMSYSLLLKRKLMIDVVALAALYGIRVLAGGAAAGILLSNWLVGFCFFIFLSLALVKRMAEMMALAPNSTGKIKGRGYRSEDRSSIVALTAASGFVAVLVFALYINSPEVDALYRRPEMLWGICIILVYWLGRVYFLAGRGEMHQDPVIFAATDRISQLVGLLVLAVLAAAL